MYITPFYGAIFGFVLIFLGVRTLRRESTDFADRCAAALRFSW